MKKIVLVLSILCFVTLFGTKVNHDLKNPDPNASYKIKDDIRKQFGYMQKAQEKLYIINNSNKQELLNNIDTYLRALEYQMLNLGRLKNALR